MLSCRSPQIISAVKSTAATAAGHFIIEISFNDFPSWVLYISSLKSAVKKLLDQGIPEVRSMVPDVSNLLTEPPFLKLTDVTLADADTNPKFEANNPLIALVLDFTCPTLTAPLPPCHDFFAQGKLK